MHVHNLELQAVGVAEIDRIVTAGPNGNSPGPSRARVHRVVSQPQPGCFPAFVSWCLIHVESSHQ